MSEPTIRVKSLKDYKPHPENANQHTERGLQVIEDSANFNGAGRSGLAANDDTLLAGNGTWEAMARAGIEEVVEVETDGHQWVIVKRRDLSPHDAKAKALMVSDNRASELGYDPDQELLGALLANIAAEDEALLRGAGFTERELAELIATLEQPSTDEWGNALGGLAGGDRAPFQQMTFTLHDVQAQHVVDALRIAKMFGPYESLNENSNGNALARICETYITDYGQS